MVWVDPATVVPAGERNGSIIAPFATVQAAIDSLVGQSRAAIALCPGDYAGAPSAWTDPAGVLLALFGFGGVRNVGAITSALVAATLRLQGIGTADAPLASVALTDTALVVFDCEMAAVTASAGSVLQLTDSRFASLLQSPGQIEARDCRFAEVSGGNWQAWNCLFEDTAAFDAIEAVGCVLDAPFTAGPATMTGCVVADGDFTDGLNATACLFTAPIVAVAIVAGSCVFQSSLEATGSCAITSSEVRAGIDATGVPLQIDSASYAFARRVGAVTFGTLQFVDPPTAATVSVVVPAVLVGQVGYANAALVGTALENLFAVNDPVAVNPQTDLVAAGAGGGLINARVSAANTVRLAFVGPLAGGAANFRIARVK